MILHRHYISGAWYVKKMVFNNSFEYTAAERGYHYFKTIWQSKGNEVLVCLFENGNSYDIFAIQTCDERN